MNTRSASTRRLSADQIAFFQREGYLIVPDIFAPGDLEPLRQEIATQVDHAARQLHAAGKLTNLHAAEPLERRLTRIYRDSAANASTVMASLLGRAGGGHRGREMFNVIKHPKLLAVIESLVGPEIVASSVYRVRPKIPGYSAGVVPWHQDSGYFAPLCDVHPILTCWLPLVPATRENGCMQILPRAHRRGIAPHHTGGNANFLVINDDDLPSSPAEAVTAECPLGGAVLMTNLTPHCSTENRSDVVRWSVDLRYQAASVPSNVDLLPAADRELPAEINMACYPPEADFVVQSRTHPERVADFAAFVSRRQAWDDTKGISSPKRGWTPVTAG
jgi:phytanoyl-CoA hydroxylase